MGVLVDRPPKARVRLVKNAHLVRSYKTRRDGSTYEDGAELEDGGSGSHISSCVKARYSCFLPGKALYNSLTIISNEGPIKQVAVGRNRLVVHHLLLQIICPLLTGDRETGQ